MSIYDVNPEELIEKTAEELKKLGLKQPEWAMFVKTGTSKERPPFETDWWYMRVASILRTVAILGPVGTSKLRTKYGGKKRRGHKPPRFKKGSGSIIRKALQQLDKAGLTTFVEKNVKKGRVITPKGKSLLDKLSIQIQKATPRIIRKVVEIEETKEIAVKPNQEVEQVKTEIKQPVKVEAKAELKQPVKVEAKIAVKPKQDVVEQIKAEVKQPVKVEAKPKKVEVKKEG
jgi:small subunit ribosomal protein S19e